MNDTREYFNGETGEIVSQEMMETFLFENPLIYSRVSPCVVHEIHSNGQFSCFTLFDLS